MYKTCFECPHIREYHPGQRGRVSWICPKLTKIIGKYFYICRMGTRSTRCPLLKKNKRGGKEMKEDNGNGQEVDREKLDIKKKLIDEVINLIKAKRDTSVYEYPGKDKCLNEIIAILESYRGKEEGGPDVTAELVNLYHHDPISKSVIQYLLNKYKIIPINAIESIRIHQEEILLNIVMIYKKMWDARGKIMLKAMQSGGKPMRITIKERGKDENIEHGKQTQGSSEDGETKGRDIKGEDRENLNKKNSDKT